MTPDKHTLDALRIDRTKASARKAPVGWILLFVIVLGAAAGGYWWLQRPRPTPVRTVVVRAEPAGSKNSPALLNASGYVTARREATISSKITGKVVEVLVEEGMEVETGQELARLDASNVEKNLLLAQAQLESARQAIDETRANLIQAERELRRLERLSREQAASQIELDRAETEYKALQARLERQEADIIVNERQVALWKQELDDTIIRAPFAGVVTSKNAQPGEMISPISAGGGFTRTGICTIVDMSSLEIEVDVNESYINRVHPGQPAEAVLDSYPQWRIPARVIAIIPTADRQKATVRVRVGFAQLDPRILPDMSVKVAFLSSDAGETDQLETAVTIPATAVHKREGRDVVWVVRDGRVERRAITVASTNGDAVAIAAGLAVGERVVVEGGDQLTDGARVTEENS
jgi:RND family efflux transporter MFP subunit